MSVKTCAVAAMTLIISTTHAQNIQSLAFEKVQAGQTAYVQIEGASGQQRLSLAGIEVVASPVSDEPNWWSFKLPAITPLGPQPLRLLTTVNEVMLEVLPTKGSVYILKSGRDRKALGGSSYLIVTSRPIPPTPLGEFLSSDFSDSTSTEQEFIRVKKAAALKSIRRSYNQPEVIPAATNLPSGQLPGRGAVCGQYLNTIEGIENINGSEVESSIADLGMVLHVDPTSVLHPATQSSPPVAVPQTRSQKEKFNRFMRDTIGLFRADGQRIPPRRAPGVTVYVIDTAHEDGGKIIDPFVFSRKMPLALADPEGAKTGEILVPQHGAQVGSLIASPSDGVAPFTDIKYRAVCSEHECDNVRLLVSICEATQESETGRPVIVNLSLGGETNNEVLRAALLDLTRSGAAIVVSYGNDDICEDYPPDANCNQYPADWTNSGWPGLYSVGAWSPENADGPISGFNRGEGSGADTLTSPTLYAPAAFYLPVRSVTPPQAELLPYFGNSFATPLVTGALALWRTCHPSTSGWPKSEMLADHTSGAYRILDLRRLLEGCQP